MTTLSSDIKISRRSTYVITVNTPWKTYTTETWHCWSECKKNAPDAYKNIQKMFLRKRIRTRKSKQRYEYRLVNKIIQKYTKIQWKFTGAAILFSRETTKHTVKDLLPYLTICGRQQTIYKNKGYRWKTQIWYGLEQNRNWSSSRLDQNILGGPGSEVMLYNTHTIT